MAACPECGVEVDEPSMRLGEVIVCRSCGADLEVISQDPLIFEVYEQEEK